MGKLISRLQKFSASNIAPPVGSKVAGITPDGKQLYELETQRVRAVPRIDPKTGERVFAKHPTTAEPLYGKNVPERYVQKRLFIMEDQGNGNAGPQAYHQPSPEELAKEQRSLKVKAMEGKLAEALVDLGVDSVEDLARRLTGANGAPQTITAAPDATQSNDQDKQKVEITLGIPEHQGAGWWVLSNGEKFRGSEKAAEDRELDIYEAKLNAAQAPEI
jgi:hypothetical protein